ncbi:hypothetical protein [Aquimarina sp. 2304DJ70-9]|uniref:hypothetical protein n=1 Tax=Aquimarina penaris TaxID=3231044 RepID=UPI003461E2A1
MYIQKILFISFLILLSTKMMGQTPIVKKEDSTAIKIFNKEETDYIKQWMGNMIMDTEMTPEMASNFKIITFYFGFKMKQLGEDPKLTKIEIIHEFNELIKEQNNELKKVLPEKQFTSFSNLFNKLSWSVNKRLNQL